MSDFDPLEMQLLTYVDHWKREAQRAIAACKKTERIRNIFSWLPALPAFGGYCQCCYQWRFGWAGFALGLFVSLTVLNWGLWTLVLRGRREGKRICGYAQVEFARHLQAYRTHKERGFE